MKKILTLFAFMLTMVSAVHGAATLTLDDSLKVKPGESFTFNVNLTNENPVSGIELKISLPTGLSFVGTEEDGETYYGEATDRSSAAFSGTSLSSGGVLTAAYLATAVKNRIKAGEGSILSLTVKAAADAPLGIGKIKIYDMEIAYPGAPAENPADAEYDCKIYEVFTVTAASANSVMGSVTGGGSYESNTNATLTATAVNGYHFVKWSNEVTDNPYTFNVTAAVSLTASFAPNQYTMTFKPDNGESDVVKTQDYASELSAPANPTKTGFTFKGWNPEVPATVPASNQTYTAQWERNSYKLTWDVDGVKSESTVLYEAAVTKPADPVKTGYTFAGWTPAVAETMPAGDVTYTATWTINQYTATFKLENGESDVVKTQDYATELTAPANPAKTGFTFKGWNPEVPATVPASNQTYTAQWERNSYKLTWDVDGVKSESTVLYEAAVTKPADPVKTGYTFAGWTPAVAETMPASNVTYTATWTVNQYKVTFKDYNGDVLLAETAYDYNSNLTAPDMTGKTNADGAPFAGWDNDYNGKVPASDITYTALYGGTYTISFVVDGETVQTAEVEYNTGITAPASPEKTGYTFSGWKDQYDKLFAEYNGKMPAKNVTFTAQWTVNKYTVTFVQNNGSADIVYTLDFGSAITAPADPVKTGHTFTGWTPAVAATVPAGNLSYEATYEINSYKVIYMVYGEEWARDTVVFNEPIVKRTYSGTILDDFTEWTSDAVYSTMPDHDVVYTANITRLPLVSLSSEMIQDIANLTYTGSALQPALTVKYQSPKFGEQTLVPGSDFTASYSDNVNAGTATVTISAVDGSCYTGTASKTFTIQKADVTVSKAPAGLTLVYTGQPQALIEAGTVSGGTVLYSADGVNFSEIIPTGTEMQVYTLYYKIVGDANHNDVDAQTITAEIKGFPVKVPAGQFVTYCSSLALKIDAASAEGTQLYTVTAVNGADVTVTALTVAAAQTPLLVYNSTDAEKTVILVPTADAADNVSAAAEFKGTLVDRTFTAGDMKAADYYVSNGHDFILVKGEGTIAANRCWMEIGKSASAPARRLTITFGEPSTGIESVINEVEDGNWYDLNGSRLDSRPARKGLFIRNGRKVVVK